MLKRQRGHKARLCLTPAQTLAAEDQGHAARTMWNLVHDWWTMLPKERRNLAAADEAIRQGRKDLPWLGILPAQAAQAVLKTYFQAWKNAGKAGLTSRASRAASAPAWPSTSRRAATSRSSG